MNNSTLPRFLEELLGNPPHHGDGVHKWLFNVSRHLHAHMGEIEMIALLTDKTRNCGRAVPQREIREAVRWALAAAWHPPADDGRVTPQAPSKPTWPAVDAAYRKFVVEQYGFGLADLFEQSPLPLSDTEARTEEIIDHLFPGNPLLCCGLSSSVFATRAREEWRGQLSRQQLIVPSPMSAPTGHRKSDGKESAHTLENTGPRRFIITEFDSGTADEQAAIILHLKAYAPLVMAVHSGSKSVHGWFYCAHAHLKQTGDFFRYAVRLGADPATWTRSQFVRMPDGTRDNGQRQCIYYLDLAPLLR